MPTYKAYGLTIRSDIALPALPECPIDGAGDIEISQAAIADDPNRTTSFRNWHAGPDQLLSEYYDVGRVLVRGGDTIQYERCEGSDDTEIVSFLLGTSLAAALMQRRILPLHSCAVLTDKGAVLVMGVSGAGKSTTLGGLLSLDLPMIADDVTGLVIDDAGTALAVPAFPSVRLWEDSLNALGHTQEGLPQVRGDILKYYLPVENFHDQQTPIRAIVHLHPGKQAGLNIEEVNADQRVFTLSQFIFRKNFIDGMGLRRFAFDTVSKTINQVTLLKVDRPEQGVSPREVARQILEFLDQSESDKAPSSDAA